MIRDPKVNYVAVGAFVIASIVGLVVTIAILSGSTGRTDSYHTIVRNVTGVKFGTQVVYEGYPIGQVENVTPMAEGSGMRFRVDLEVRSGWRIPSDSVATIAAPGLLSAVTISIAAGKSEAALKPGDPVPSGESTNMFAVMSSVAGQLGALAENQIKPLLLNLNKVVAELGGMIEQDGKTAFRDLAGLVKDTTALVQDLTRRVPAIADDVQTFAQRMKANSEEFSALLTPENRARLERAISSLDTAVVDLGELAKLTRGLVADNRSNIDKSVADARYVVESVARHIDSINQNMEGAARNMYEFSRQIRQNPGLLLGGTPPRDTAPAR